MQPHTPLDGGLFDAITVFIGLLCVAAKVAFRWALSYSPAFKASRASADFLNGCVVFPFIALAILPIVAALAPIIAAPWLVSFVDMLRMSNIGSIALAGGVGLFFVLGELANID